VAYSSQRSNAAAPAVSIRDVAAAAGVSIATVSRVLHDSPMVAPATAARVREVIKSLNYVPNPLAQVLSSGETHVMGLALPRFHGEFMSWLLHGADEEATALGYHLMMTTIAKGVDGKSRRRVLGSDLIDAMLVVITDINDPLASEVIASGVPSVVLDTDMSARGLDSVILDNEKGTREAVEHLARWVEPQHLYFVGGPRNNFDSLQRANAFTSGLESLGCTPTSDQVSMGDYSLDWGKEWAMRMIRRKLLGGAGVLAANDKIACGVMRAAEDAGISIPDQLRVVGFNDSYISRIARPGLSTVSLPMAEMGATAVRLLVRRLENRSADVLCTRLPTKLVVRESSTAKNF
jgi:LacI family transcriptional regulator